MNKEEKLDLIFHALSDSTRRKILEMVANRECSISELVGPFEMTFAAVSKHIRILERAGFIKRSVDGRVHRCKGVMKPMDTATSYIEKYKKHWEKQLDLLEKYLESKK